MALPVVADPMIAGPPTDSIQSIAFSPVRAEQNIDYLATADWSNEVRIYRISNGQSEPFAGYTHDGPVMDLAWMPDGTKLFSVGSDKALKIFDLQTKTPTQMGAHDAPIKTVRYATATNGSQYLITGGWDKMLKYWDPRTGGAVGAVPLPERCYSFDTSGDLVVVGSAERKIQIYDIRNPSQVVKEIDSPLKWQTRVISCFPQAQGKPGYAVGSIEGRVAYHYLQDPDTTNNFSFKCHRKEVAADISKSIPKKSIVYSVNTIAFHRQYGTFVTGGGDGQLHFWDAQSRARLKSINPQSFLPANLQPAANQPPTPITSASFNADHTVLAYAASYDWSRGHAGAGSQADQPRIHLHLIKDEEVKPRKK